MKKILFLSLLVGLLAQAQYPPTPVSQSTTPWVVDGSGVTQPVSAGSLPLPTGASTSANQTTVISSLGTINSTLGSPFQAGGSIGNSSFGISGTLPAFTSTPTVNLGTIGTAATATNQTTIISSLGSIISNQTNGTQVVGLPSGAATAALQVANLMNDVSATGAITTTGTNVQIDCTGLSSVTADIQNNTGTIGFQASVDGTNYFIISAVNISSSGGYSGQLPVSAPSNGQYKFSVSGYKYLRLINTGGPTLAATVFLRGNVGSNIVEGIHDQVYVFGGPVSLDAGSALVGNVGVAQASTTSGQSGPLVQGATTTSAPTYTTAKTNPLSLDTSGNLRSVLGSGLASIGSVGQAGTWSVGLSTGSNTIGALSSGLASIGSVGQAGTWNVGLSSGTNTIGALSSGLASIGSVGQAGTWTVQPGNTANTTAWLVTGTGGTFPSTQSGNWSDLATQTNATSANNKSHVVGGVYNSSPATLTTGQVGSLQLDSAQNLLNRINFALPTGTNTIGNVTINSLAKAEDAASADGDYGIPTLAIRKASPANTSGADGDYEALQMSAGRLWTSSTIDAALPAGTNSIGTVNQGTSAADTKAWPVNIASFGDTAISTGTGASGTGIPRVTISNDSSLAANQSVNVAQVNGVATSVNTGSSGTGTQRVTIASDAQVSLGTTVNKTNVFKSGTLISAGTGAKQTILTYTVTAGKTFYLQWYAVDAAFATVSATGTILGIASLESPSGTTIVSNTFNNTTNEQVDRIQYFFSEPIPISSGTVIRSVASPAVSTSINWIGNFGGYEK